MCLYNSVCICTTLAVGRGGGGWGWGGGSYEALNYVNNICFSLFVKLLGLFRFDDEELCQSLVKYFRGVQNIKYDQHSSQILDLNQLGENSCRSQVKLKALPNIQISVGAGEVIRLPFTT